MADLPAQDHGAAADPGDHLLDPDGGRLAHPVRGARGGSRRCAAQAPDRHTPVPDGILDPVLRCRPRRRPGPPASRPGLRPHGRGQAHRRRGDATTASGRRTMAETSRVVCIGASTGGTEALRDVLEDAAGGMPRDRHRAAHAGALHRCLRPAAGRDLRHLREGGGGRRRGAAGPGPDRAGRAAPAAPAQRRSIQRRRQGRAARFAPSPLRRCAVPLRRPERGKQRPRHPDDGPWATTAPPASWRCARPGR